MTHICVSKLTIIGSDKGLSPDRRQAIIWTNAGILLIGPLGTNFSEILINIHAFSFKKMHLKMSYGKWRPFCLGLGVLVNKRSPWSKCFGHIQNIPRNIHTVLFSFILLCLHCKYFGSIRSIYLVSFCAASRALVHRYDCTSASLVILHEGSGIILCMRPANARRRYFVMPSLTDWAQILDDPWMIWEALRELWNPMSKAVPGKFHGSGGYNKYNCLQDWANFLRFRTRQLSLIFNTGI